ncbi:uncharacterized protein VTP21DRAFT_8032 [Calcarisporiella thermophila]|uniref:uncharacterized protein n=1 Tax=Calcarisporiella thermophila TaxID=911321 RepID=UPI00374228FE
MVQFRIKILLVFSALGLTLVNGNQLQGSTLALNHDNVLREERRQHAKNSAYCPTKQAKFAKRILPPAPKALKDELLSRWMRVPRQKPLNVGVLIGNNLDAFNMMSASTMLSFIPDVNILPIAETMDPIRTMDGFAIKPKHSFNEIIDLDLLVIPAGVGPEASTTAWLRRVIPTVRKYVLSICEGSMTLAATGFLDGKPATTTKSLWKMTDLFPRVKWVKKARFTHDDKFVTTSGAVAGLDGLFYTVKLIYGEDVARKVAKMNEYEWNPDPGHDIFSEIEKDFTFVPDVLFPTFSSFNVSSSNSTI